MVLMENGEKFQYLKIFLGNPMNELRSDPAWSETVADCLITLIDESRHDAELRAEAKAWVMAYVMGLLR